MLIHWLKNTAINIVIDCFEKLFINLFSLYLAQLSMYHAGKLSNFCGFRLQLVKRKNIELIRFNQKNQQYNPVHLL